MLPLTSVVLSFSATAPRQYVILIQSSKSSISAAKTAAISPLDCPTTAVETAPHDFRSCVKDSWIAMHDDWL
ncbi:hypothetical protein BDV36DRAFT_263531, partial [Aspergillus pseudocaelatus]